MKLSVASLKERLTDWVTPDIAIYELGACLGFWSDFGAPPGEDQWNGVKWVMWSNNPLGNSIHNFLAELVFVKMLEERETESGLEYRWNPEYKELDNE